MDWSGRHILRSDKGFGMELTFRQAVGIILLALALVPVAFPVAANPLFQGWSKVQAAREVPPAKTEQQEDTGTRAAIPEEEAEFKLEQLLDRTVSEAEHAAETLIQRLGFALSGFRGADREITLALERMTEGASVGGLLGAMGLAGIPFLLGFAVELAYARRLRSAERWLAGPANVPLLVLPRILGLGALHISRIVVFMLVALTMVVLILPDEGLARRLALFFAIPVFRLRIILLAVWLLFMPSRPSIRPLPCAQPCARHLFLWISAFFITTIFAYNIIRLLRSHGLSDQHHLLLTIFEICLSLGILFALVWTSPRPAAKARWIHDWRLLATAFLCVMLLAYIASVLLGRQAFRWDLLLSLATIPIFIAADTAVRSTILAALARKETGQDKEPAILGVNAAHLMTGFRILLAVSWVFLLLWIWGVRFSFEAAVARIVFSLVTTVVLGWFLWEWIRSAIDRRLTDEPREESGARDRDEEREDVEEMGIGGSRKTTLLTLARKFLLAALFISTGLILLSALGIDIAPLLAGAGIVGLAIGFGAQTLVKDILSGVFFLLDDAFRLGDYIEADTYKGTVVHISVRSLKLRHPRGKLLTIPYGTLGAITNYSRDWAIMKLDLRVPYDTDLEKVRKIIKKLGQKLSEDKELGPKFLAPLKSQGVREIDDSAMILRVKFKSRPHDQFILRREVFKHIQNKFAENGIEFAPRKVTIHIPDTYLGGSRKELDMAIMAAAAESALEEKPPHDEAAKSEKP